jgi:hypothetical protein
MFYLNLCNVLRESSLITVYYYFEVHIFNLDCTSYLKV